MKRSEISMDIVRIRQEVDQQSAVVRDRVDNLESRVERISERFREIEHREQTVIYMRDWTLLHHDIDYSSLISDLTWNISSRSGGLMPTVTPTAVHVAPDTHDHCNLADSTPKLRSSILTGAAFGTSILGITAGGVLLASGQFLFGTASLFVGMATALVGIIEITRST